MVTFDGAVVEEGKIKRREALILFPVYARLFPLPAGNLERGVEARDSNYGNVSSL
ncbi:hypothetical protein KXX57_002625 [Aspergillus fumigatus]|nr:hypothetical protein KXX57_002625 [Aspergillus fumigatus]KAH1981015.1 hypothetical protein KXW88_006311 [Aspergillus fumigatus]